jgi:hypothetical protein
MPETVRADYERKRKAKDDYNKQKMPSSIPGRAIGDNNWRGGLVQVHEKGGEILDLPKGTRIYPNDISKEMARAYGAEMAKQKASININNVFKSPKALDEMQINRMFRKEAQNLQLMLQGV